METTAQTIDIAWILVCAALVMLMQAGFSCLESGLVRTKNSINVAAKNFADFCPSPPGFNLDYRFVPVGEQQLAPTGFHANIEFAFCLPARGNIGQRLE